MRTSVYSSSLSLLLCLACDAQSQPAPKQGAREATAKPEIAAPQQAAAPTQGAPSKTEGEPAKTEEEPAKMEAEPGNSGVSSEAGEAPRDEGPWGADTDPEDYGVSGIGLSTGGRGKDDEPLEEGPEGEVVLAQVDNQGELDVASLRAVIDKHLEEIGECYSSALAMDPELRGAFELKLVVTAEGKVGSVVHNNTKLSKIATCATKTAKRWTFAGAGPGINLVTASFELSPA